MRLEICVFCDEVSFLDAIARNPHDKDLRLVYADWLEENYSAERAEYLRLLEARPGCARLRALAGKLDPAWIGLLNSNLLPGDRIAILAGDLEGFEATVQEIHWRRGVAAVFPSLFCRPYPFPEVPLTQMVRITENQAH